MRKTGTTGSELAAREEAPGYIEKQEGVRSGFEDMQANDLVTPMAVLVQKAHKEELIDQYGVGSIAIPTSDLLLCDKEGSITVVPVKHYVDYVEWDPTDATRTKPPLARSMDRNGALAARFNAGEKVRNAEDKEIFAVTASHRFICLVGNLPFPVMFAFRRTSFKHGKAFLNLAFYRGDYPLYAGKYAVKPLKQANPAGQDYYVMQVANAGWADEAEYQRAKLLHEKVKDIAKLVVLGDDEERHEEPASPAGRPEI